MNPKNTWCWVLAAAALFAGIFLYQRFAPKPETGPAKLLPGLVAAQVASVEIIPANQRAIRAERTNGFWQLTEPVSYPAAATNINRLLGVFEQIIPDNRISAQELSGVRDTDEKFGFNPPPFTVILQPGDLHIQTGNRTAPGDQLFVKVVGVNGIFVVDANLLRLIPRTQEAWRDPALVDLARLDFDRLIVTSAGKNLELQRNPTNRLWRMMPMNVRADADKIDEALAKLEQLRVGQFFDPPRAEFDSFGLQTPDLTLAFKTGTNSALLLAFGKSPTNDTGSVYARRNDEKIVATVSRELLEPWRTSAENFRDRHLVSPTGPLAAIEIHGQESFTLLRTNNAWLVTPQNFPADPALVTALLTNLGGLQVAQFVKDVVVASDFSEKGLAAPAYQIILHAAATNAAEPVAEIDFGTNQNDLIFARRADEPAVYAVRLADLSRLPATALQMRDHAIWNFNETNIARLTVRQNGRTLQLDRKGTNQWSVAAGSQGMINVFAIEETAHRLGELAADAWVERGDQNRARYGFQPDGWRITVELTNGEKKSVELGGSAGPGTTYALAEVDHEPWIFEFPPVLFQFVQLYLTIPSGPP